MALNEYIQRIGAAVSTHDGVALAELLHYYRLSPTDKKVVLMAANVGKLSKLIKDWIGQPFDMVIQNHIRSITLTESGQHEEAFKHQQHAALALYDIMERDRDSNWFIPVINVVALQLRLSSYAADASSGNDKDNKKKNKRNELQNQN